MCSDACIYNQICSIARSDTKRKSKDVQININLAALAEGPSLAWHVPGRLAATSGCLALRAPQTVGIREAGSLRWQSRQDSAMEWRWKVTMLHAQGLQQSLLPQPLEMGAAL